MTDELVGYGHSYEKERRRNDTIMLALVQDIRKTVNDLTEKLDAHIIAESTLRRDLIKDAFPDNDPHGHRRLHEASLQRAEDQAAFWGKMRFEITRWGLLGFCGWAAYALWKAALAGVMLR